ncbi:MAG TPA: transcriptional regulator, partial [Methylophilaceae bacterium]|nr:transcriptional regulator [Methylophilaceae bacterium]
TYISGIERGLRNVSLINIVKLANALNISVTAIVDFDGQHHG